MKDIQVFTNAQFGQIRTVNKDGEPWFVAADVCRALDHSNVTVALDRLDDDERAKFNLGLSGGDTNCVNEPGLYSLVLGSRKPEARAFKRWITHEVVPTIRKHGAYMTPQKIEEVLLNPDTIISLAQRLKAEQEQRKALEAANSTLTVQNTIMAPKADYFDELVDRHLLTGFRETAKELKVKERAFIAYLIDKKYVYRDKRGKLMPYAEKNNGLFEIKECYNDKSDWVGPQTLITPKGRETFRLLTRGL